MSDQLQQLQPVLLLEELKQHEQLSIMQLDSSFKDENNTSISSIDSNGSGSTTGSGNGQESTMELLLKEQNEYYLRKAKELITLCASFVTTQRSFMASIDFNPDFDQAAAQMLSQEMVQVVSLVRIVHAAVYNLVRTYEFVVSYTLMNKLEDLENLCEHLTILANELMALKQTGTGSPGAILVYIKQPFPGILKRYKQIMADSFVVELLTTSQFPYSYGKLRVTTNDVLTSSSGAALFETQAFDIQHENGRFLARIPIKLMQGTSRFSTLKCSLTLNHKSTKHQVVIESRLSDRFISFVNDSQWVEYFGLLLKEEIFLLENGQYVYERVSHSRIINVLMKYFHLCLKIYKRSLTSTHRPLPVEPLQQLLKKISGDKFTISHFETFMSIISPSLKVIKYQRHVLELWNQGLLFYFIDQEAAKQLLGDRTDRFIITFSPDLPYCWVLKHVQREGADGPVQVIDKVVDMKIDLTGDRATKSIVTYIESNLPSFTEICQFDYKQNTISFINRDDAFVQVKSNNSSTNSSASSSTTTSPPTASTNVQKSS